MTNLVYLNVFCALLFVIGLIGGIAYLARRFNLQKYLNAGNSLNKRLSIEDSIMIDSKRRLLLIKRDDASHLILISPNHELVIEQNIKSST